MCSLSWGTVSVWRKKVQNVAWHILNQDKIIITCTCIWQTWVQMDVTVSRCSGGFLSAVTFTVLHTFAHLQDTPFTVTVIILWELR